MNRYRGRKRPVPVGPVMGMVTRVTNPRESWGEPHLLSQEEVAYRLSISRTSLWRLIKQGELESVSIGSRTFVTSSSIDDFINRHTSRKAK